MRLMDALETWTTSPTPTSTSIFPKSFWKPNVQYTEELEFAKDLASEAGKIMRKYFRSTENGAELKSDKTIVTLADTEINSLLIQRSKVEFPAYSILGEEEVFEVEDAKYAWVCDPVDGTQPFANGIPISTFSLALVDSEGISVLGVVYDPFQDRLYEAVRGSGAFLNGQPIHVSAKNTLEGAYIDEELWVNQPEGVSFDDPKDRLNKSGAEVMTFCSAVITGCLVAQGVYDAMLFGQSKPEDIAALSVIVEEAGGKVTNLLGGQQRYDRKLYGAVVSNGQIHDALVEVTSSMNYKSTNVVLPA